MRLWTPRSGRFGLLASSFLLLFGCGGSSSETPEPVRPDSWQLKLRHQRQLAAAENDEPTRLLNRADGFEPGPPPRSTWGTEGARLSGSKRSNSTANEPPTISPTLKLAPLEPNSQEATPAVPRKKPSSPKAPVNKATAPKAPVEKSTAPKAPVEKLTAPKAPVEKPTAPKAPPN